MPALLFWVIRAQSLLLHRPKVKDVINPLGPSHSWGNIPVVDKRELQTNLDLVNGFLALIE